MSENDREKRRKNPKRAFALAVVLSTFVFYLPATILWFLFVLHWNVLPAALVAVLSGSVFIGLTVLVVNFRYLAKHAEPSAVSQDGEGEENAEEQPPPKKIVGKAIELAHVRKRVLQAQHRRMIGKLLVVGSIIALAAVLFAEYMWRAYGLFPREVFLLPLPMLLIAWWLIIALFPRPVIYLLLFMMVGSRMLAAFMGMDLLIRMLPTLLILPFFYGIQMFLMYGMLALPNFLRINIILPGDASWGKTLDDLRGQPEAKAQITAALRKMQLAAEARSYRGLRGILMAVVSFGKQQSLRLFYRLFANEKYDAIMAQLAQRRRVFMTERGILFEGPPGTGKTLAATAIATTMQYPMIFTEGSAFLATFIGISPMIMYVIKALAASLDKTYGGVVVTFDEAEMLLRKRAGGMDGGGTGGSSKTLYDALTFDAFGTFSECGLMFDTKAARERFWPLKYPDRYTGPTVHPIIMGGFGGSGTMGAENVLMTWMSGVEKPPFLRRLIRKKINALLDALVVLPAVVPAVRFRGKPIFLRLPAAKPNPSNIIFLAMTNRPDWIDEAFLRPGRYGRHIHFGTPGEVERQEIFDLYLRKLKERGALHPSLDTEERLIALARATAGMSPADIEQLVHDAEWYADNRADRLAEIKAKLDGGTPLEALERDEKHLWERYQRALTSGLDWLHDRRADWDAMQEARGAIRYGMARPTLTTPRHRKMTAVHELRGHLMVMLGFCGDFWRPTTLSIMPRGRTLGLVDRSPVEEHDPQPQYLIDGLVRTSIGSLVAERMWFTDNQPGVESDLANATRLTCLQVAEWGMTPRQCRDEDREKYAKIGETLYSLGSDNPAYYGGGAGSFIASVLRNPAKARAVMIMLGQAGADVWRFLDKNKDVGEWLLERLLEEDEIIGLDLEKAVERLLRELRPLTPDDLERWPPEEIFAPKHPVLWESRPLTD